MAKKKKPTAGELHLVRLQARNYGSEAGTLMNYPYSAVREGRRVLTEDGNAGGRVVGWSECPRHVCRGRRIHVRWENGKLTKICLRQVRFLEDRSLQIFRIPGRD